MDFRALAKELLLEFWDREIPRVQAREVSIGDPSKKIISIVGMRRAGKTFYLFQLINELLDAKVTSEQIAYFNLEDDRLIALGYRELALLLEAVYALYPENYNRDVFLFLDEIQNIDGWANVVRRFFDTKRARIFISGSSAKLLSKEIATSLRGRALSYEVWPYSFKEYLLAKEIAFPKKNFSPSARDRLTKHLELYLEDGGFPETIGMSPKDRAQTLQSYVDIVILRDIIERYHISSTHLIRTLISALLSNSGRKFSVNKFYNDLKSQGVKVGKNTIYEYLEYIEDSFLGFSVSQYAESERVRKNSPKKIYAIDPGLVSAYTFSWSRNIGQLFENVFYLDLRRNGYDVCYYTTKSGYEIDFVAVDKISKKRQIYQVAYDVIDVKTKDRKIRALEEACEELNMEGEIVTPRNYFDISV